MNPLTTAPRAERIPEYAHSIYAFIPKPILLIEKASSNPIETIAEVSPFIEYLRDTHLPRWLCTAIINENSTYADPEHHTALFHFYDNLLLLIDALVAINNQNFKWEISYEEIEIPPQPIFLTEEQIANPEIIVKDFCRQFSAEYTRRELWHFLEAGVTLAGDYPKGFCPGIALMSYNCVSCLTEAAYCLHGD
jgi:hypothetical protein